MMDRFQVAIYIETSFHGPAVRDAAGEWLIEYIKTDGSPETRQGVICREKTTENALVLELMTEAFGKLTKPCSVRVNTGCEHILNVMNNHWLPQWEKAGWVSAKGKLIRNMYLWQQCAEAMREHVVSFENGWHSYRNKMQWELEKEVRKFLEEQRQKNIENTRKETGFMNRGKEGQYV